MKSAILYATTNKPEQDGYSPTGGKDHTGKLWVIWVRTEIVNDDVAGALDRAKPRLGEIVLNSIPLP